MMSILKAISKLASTYLNGKIRKSEARAEHSASWDEIAQTNSSTSWKDEYLTLLISIPLIMCFIPSLVPYVREGFLVLDTMPTWYQYTFSVIVAASFGVRGAIGLMNKVKK
jgi:hypothetical protein